jgi:hypothetical protein
LSFEAFEDYEGEDEEEEGDGGAKAQEKGD